MALITPEYLQSKKYRALRDRLAFQHGGNIQPGAWLDGDLLVTANGTPNLSANVAAGFGLILATDPGNRGVYHVENDATVNVTTGATAGHATLPRIDQLALVINDTTDGADASDIPTLAIYPGTATSGATLDNRSGAATLPNSSLLLADILMPAAATTITSGNIRDKRGDAQSRYPFSTAGAALLAPVANTFYSLPLSAASADPFNVCRAGSSGVGRIVIPRTGWWHFDFLIQFSSLATGQRIVRLLNMTTSGTNILMSMPVDTNETSVQAPDWNLSWTGKLSAGDEIVVQSQVSSTASSTTIGRWVGFKVRD